MFGRVSPFILFTWTLTLSLSPLVRGQARVIGDPAVVKARVGDDVLLPCRCDPPTDLRSVTVEWSRADMRPDPSDRQKRVPFVHVHTDHCDDDLDMKIPAFVNRTKLFPEQLATGVASLLIQSVTVSDSGTYKCFIPSLRTDQDLQWTHVTLIVDPSVEAVTPTHDPSLIPGFNDGASDDKTNTASDRTRVVPITVFTLFGLLIVLLAMYYFKDHLKQLIKKNKGLQQNEAVCEKGDLAPSERKDSVAVNVEDEKLLIPQPS